MRSSLALKLTVHLVRRHVHLVEPPLQERRVVGLQGRIALRQARDLDLLRQDLVVECLVVSLLTLLASRLAPPTGSPSAHKRAAGVRLTLTSSSRILHLSSQFRSLRVPPSRASLSSRTSSRRPRTSSSLSRRLSAIASCLFCAAACVRYSVASSVRIAFSCASRCETSGADEDLELATTTTQIAVDCPCKLCFLRLVATHPSRPGARSGGESRAETDSCFGCLRQPESTHPSPPPPLRSAALRTFSSLAALASRWSAC